MAWGTQTKHKDIRKRSFLTFGTTTAYVIAYNRMTSLDDRVRIDVKFHVTNTWPATLQVEYNGAPISGWAKPIVDQNGLAVSNGNLKATGAYTVEYDTANGRFILVSWPVGAKRSDIVDNGEIQFVNDVDIPKDYTAYMIKWQTANSRGWLHPLQRDYVPVGYSMLVLPTEQLILGWEIVIDWELDCQGTLVID